MGLGIVMPGIAAILGLLGSMWKTGESTDILRKSVQNVPGTMDVGDWIVSPNKDPLGIWGTPMADLFNEAVTRNPEAISMYETLVGQRAGLDKMIEGAEGTVGRLADVPGYWRTTGEAARGRIEPRAETMFTKGEELLGQPAITQEQMDAIVGRYMATAGQAAQQRGAMAQADVGARGLSRGAARGLQEQVAQGERSQKLQSMADVAGLDLHYGAVQDQLARDLMTASGTMEGIASQAGGIYGGLETGAAQQLTTAEQWRDVLAGTPLDYTGLGDLLSSRDIYETHLLSGASASEADFFSQLFSGGMNMLGGTLDRKAQMAAMKAQQGSWLDSFLPGLASSVGTFVGGPVLGAAAGSGTKALTSKEMDQFASFAPHATSF